MSIGMAVHPTESASDGREIETSTSIKRSDLSDRYIRCSQCGFPTNLRTRPTGPSMGAIGTPNFKTESGTPPGPGVSFSDTFGDPVDTNSGCPFCNSMNPRGSGRDSDPWIKVSSNLENL